VAAPPTNEAAGIPARDDQVYALLLGVPAQNIDAVSVVTGKVLDAVMGQGTITKPLGRHPADTMEVVSETCG